MAYACLFGKAPIPYLCFLVTNRAEKELCSILQEETVKVVNEPILGRAERFAQLLDRLYEDGTLSDENMTELASQHLRTLYG